jgi:hypothetical protein
MIGTENRRVSRITRQQHLDVVGFENICSALPQLLRRCSTPEATQIILGAQRSNVFGCRDFSTHHVPCIGSAQAVDEQAQPLWTNEW